MCTWHLATLDAKPVQNVAIPLSYSERDPIPGGCNLEFDLDIDPNIYLEYNFFETTIKFAPANLGYARGADPTPCDIQTGRGSRWRLQYDVYQYFLPENDLTEEALLRHLRRMAEVPQVKASAVKVVTLTANDKTSVSFSSLRGQGVIYNVIVRDPFLNTSAAYVPAHTYTCSFVTTEGNCSSLGEYMDLNCDNSSLALQVLSTGTELKNFLNPAGADRRRWKRWWGLLGRRVVAIRGPRTLPAVCRTRAGLPRLVSDLLHSAG
ncbi:hypothetical protein CB1_002578035 [Camelus ferus]|nr:hypothetical protein CB1_002578035 [Camelus ferus]